MTDRTSNQQTDMKVAKKVTLPIGRTSSISDARIILRVMQMDGQNLRPKGKMSAIEMLRI